MYLFLCILGLLMALLLIRNSFVEMRMRQKAHRQTLHSALQLIAPGQKDQYHRLRTGYYVIGRQRRRCDLSLKQSAADGVSRVHCVLSYDDGCWFIRPLYHKNRKIGDYFSEILLNGEPVPEEGSLLEYHDEIRIGNCKLRLIHEMEVPV